MLHHVLVHRLELRLRHFAVGGHDLLVDRRINTGCTERQCVQRRQVPNLLAVQCGGNGAVVCLDRTDGASRAVNRAVCNDRIVGVAADGISRVQNAVDGKIVRSRAFEGKRHDTVLKVQRLGELQHS